MVNGEAGERTLEGSHSPAEPFVTQRHICWMAELLAQNCRSEARCEAKGIAFLAVGMGNHDFTVPCSYSSALLLAHRPHCVLYWVHQIPDGRDYWTGVETRSRMAQGPSSQHRSMRSCRTSRAFETDDVQMCIPAARWWCGRMRKVPNMTYRLERSV